MSTYFIAPSSGTGNGTIVVNAKTLNNGSSSRSAVLSISDGEKTANSTLSQRFKPTFQRSGSGDISGSGGTLTVSVNSQYPFWFRNNPSNISAITYNNTDYKSVNPISSGSYAFNVYILSNGTASARTDTLEMAFQKLNGTYSFNNSDAADFQIVFTQESGGTTPVPPTPSGDTGTTINVPIFFDSDGVNIWIGLGQSLPFVLRPSVIIEHSQGNRELITYTIPISETAITFDDGHNQPYYISDFDTSQLGDYLSVVGVYAGSGAPQTTITYRNTNYYIYWSEADSYNFRTYLENVGNNCLDDVTWGTEPSVPIPYEQQYFTIEALENGYLQWTSNNLSYSLNDGAWTANISANSIWVNQGDKVRYKSDTNTKYSGSTIASTGQINVYGNSMSLFYGDNFSGQTALPNQTYSFYRLFNNNNKLVNAENLILPATALTDYCYAQMFNGCTNLLTAPALPATALTQHCYDSMFYDCQALVNAPSLPATSLAQYCYISMFEDCYSLVTAPSLPATTLAKYCYISMFAWCESLTVAPALPATTLLDSCYRGMFSNCTSLQSAPELPATTLKNECYRNMFLNCSNLSYIKCLATNPSSFNATKNWVSGVQTNSGTFIKDTSTSWNTGVDGIPNNWTVQDA